MFACICISNACMLRPLFVFFKKKHWMHRARWIVALWLLSGCQFDRLRGKKRSRKKAGGYTQGSCSDIWPPEAKQWLTENVLHLDALWLIAFLIPALPYWQSGHVCRSGFTFLALFCFSAKCESCLTLPSQNTALVPPPAPTLLANRHASPSRSPSNHRSPPGKCVISS